MDLNELLSYKPTKKAGEKRPREGGRENVAPPSKASRSGKTPAAANVTSGAGAGDLMQAQAPSAQDNSSVAVLDLNGISYEEKLRLLQTMDVEEEDLGEGRKVLVPGWER